MNFNEIEEDIKSLDKAVREINISNETEFSKAKQFSQSLSAMTIELTKFIGSLKTANDTISKKLDAYTKKMPVPNACLACNGSGKSSNGSPCQPCKGTGRRKDSMTSVGPEGGPKENGGKIMPGQDGKGATLPKGSPEPTAAPLGFAATNPVPAPKPSMGLDDFDDGPVSEEDQLAIELQKSLF